MIFIKRKKSKLKLKSLLSTNWLLLLFILVFFLRLPSLFEPFTYGDEGIYVTLGQALRKGLVWYRDIHDNKPPMLYLLSAMANNFPNFRLINFLWSFVTIFVFYQLSGFLFPKNQKAVKISTSAFAILSSLHCFEGNVANAENFMLLPIISGVLLILKGLDSSGSETDLSRSLAAGILFGLATLFKVPAVFDFAAALVFGGLIFASQKRKNYKLFIIHYSLFIIGFLLPITLSLIYYASKGAFYPYLKAAFLQNIPYLSSWAQDKPQVSGLPIPLLGRGFLVSALTVSLFLFKEKMSQPAKIILIWFSFSWFAALLSSRPYPHYLIQILPALTLSSGFFYSQKKNYLKEKLIPKALLIILFITWAIFRFWYYPNLPYLFNFYQYALGLKSREEYFTKFDSQALAIYQTASYLQSHTLPKEKIFIWGDEPFIYSLARRLPIGRYTVAYHIIDFNGYQETIDKLKKERPRYLLIMADEKRLFPELETFVALNYNLETIIGEAKIYHRALEL